MTKLRYLASTLISLALVIPVSPNYSLQQINVGSGGIGQTDSYKFEGIMGENGMPMSGTAYNGGLGFGFTQMANVPNAPTVSNPGNYYNKLHVIIDPSSNPADTLFALAISNDSFATIQYIKSDQAIGTTLGFTDYQTYSSWGGATGFDVLGLQPNTTYQIKAKAFHGDFTESGFGPTGSATTVNPTLTFDIDVSSTDQSTTPPYILNMGTLLASTVTTATDKIWASLDTNAENGANVYIASQNTGLQSDITSHTISSTTGDLDVISEGFGLQIDNVAQFSGGPLVAHSPYDSTNNQVGQIPSTFAKLFSSTQPIIGGRGSAVLKAKVTAQTPSQSDYSDILTIISSANF